MAIHTPAAHHDVWTVDTQRTGPLNRWTTSENNLEPIWSFDGSHLLFLRVGENNLYELSLQPGSVPELVLARPGWQGPIEWTRDDHVLFMEQTPGRGWDVFELDRKSGQTTALVATDAGEYSGTVSPSGAWLAYVSDETDRLEVYLQPYHERGRKRCVSTDGGTEPVWSRDGRELFFRNAATLFAVAVPESTDEPIGTPVPLFEDHYVRGFSERPDYDVSPDGRRFVMVEGPVDQTTRGLEVFVDFADELERLLPHTR